MRRPPGQPRVGRGVAQLDGVTPDIEIIVAADRAAQREIDAVQSRLKEQQRVGRERVEQDRAARASAAHARAEAAAVALEREGRARTMARRTAREAAREARRKRAEAARAAAVDAYVAIVGGARR